MAWFTLVDWGAADWTTDASAAHERYTEHINQMMDANKAGWDQALINSLTLESETIADQVSGIFGGGGAEYWTAIAQNEPNWIVSAGKNPAAMGKIASHIAFLKSAGAAADSWENALTQYGAMNVAQAVASQSASDIADSVDPTKSIWPWLAGGAIAVFLVSSYWGRK